MAAAAPDKSRAVNKMLGNYVHVGMIDLCLPDATILHVTRHPVDNCLACYRRLFRTGHEYTYDLATLGRHYRRYREVMDHWRRVLPGRVIDVSYEALVADPETQIRRLIESCDLDWNEACLKFHETERPVKTASLAQVRKPIYRDSVDRWKQHADQLAPLLEVMGPYAPAV